jgi:VWFA-related protein
MSAPISAFTAALLVKSTLILLGALLLGRLLRDASAASRHALWTLALLGLLVLPPLSVVLPRWELPVLPTGHTVSVTHTGTASAAHVSAAAPATAALAVPVPTDPVAAPPRTADRASDAATSIVPPAPITEAAPAAAPRHWSEWLLLVWSLGTTLALLRLGAGIWVARRLVREATPVHDSEWRALVAEVSGLLRLTRRVVVLQSPDVALPVVWGYRAPRVLLPRDAFEWPHDRRRAFLLHELAHVERHDCLVQMLASITHAIYWPHPLVWWAMRRLRREAEHACDDRVLSVGTRGPDYADHLLDVARALQGARPPAVVMGIAERSNLEDRLLALLDPRLHRGAVGSRTLWAGAAAGLSLVASVAALQPVARAAMVEVLRAALPAAPARVDVVEPIAPPPAAKAPARTTRRIVVVEEEPPGADDAVTFEGEAIAVSAPPLPVDPALPAPSPEPDPVVAAPPPAPSMIVRIGTDLVQVDAVVTDKRGRQVTDLTERDFQVFEDGRPRTVTHARYVLAESSGAAAGTAAGTAPSPEDVRRTMVLVVDDLGLAFQSLHHAREGLRKLVAERIGPNDRVAVVVTSRRTAVAHALTNDKTALLAAIDGLQYNSWQRGARGVMGNPDFHNQYSADKTIAAIESLLKGLRGLPGRKSMLLFSDALSLQDGHVKIDPQLEDGVRRITDAASRAATVIYSLNLSDAFPRLETASGEFQPGARIGGPGAPMQQQLAAARGQMLRYRTADNNGLWRIADATGGRLADGVHVDAALETIMNEQQGYYLVGYAPDVESFRPQKGFRQYHAIKVRVARPGLRIRSRAGFYGVTDDEMAPASPTTLAAENR